MWLISGCKDTKNILFRKKNTVKLLFLFLDIVCWQDRRCISSTHQTIIAYLYVLEFYIVLSLVKMELNNLFS